MPWKTRNNILYTQIIWNQIIWVSFKSIKRMYSLNSNYPSYFIRWEKHLTLDLLEELDIFKALPIDCCCDGRFPHHSQWQRPLDNNPVHRCILCCTQHNNVREREDLGKIRPWARGKMLENWSSRSHLLLFCLTWSAAIIPWVSCESWQSYLVIEDLEQGEAKRGEAEDLSCAKRLRDCEAALDWPAALL